MTKESAIGLREKIGCVWKQSWLWRRAASRIIPLDARSHILNRHPPTPFKIINTLMSINSLEHTFAASDLDSEQDFFTTRGVDVTPDFAMDEFERHKCREKLWQKKGTY